MLVDGENSGEVFIVPQDGYMGSTFKQLWISSSMYEPYVLAFIQFYKGTLRNLRKVQQFHTSTKNFSMVL